MKKTVLLTLCLLFASASSFAHYLWIETSPTGKIDQEQEIRVYYGEYTYGVIEEVKGEAFPKVSKFTLWVVDPAGNKTPLTVTPTDTYYTTKFTPKSDGTYTVLLNNNEIDVLDFTQYDFGIFKTHYHSSTKINVGKSTGNTAVDNKEGITVKEVATDNGEVKLQVLYKNKALPKNEVKIYVADLWSKTLHTDEEGFISFKLPWKTKYILETTTKEEIPGTYNDKEYQFIWHCVTYCIQ